MQPDLTLVFAVENMLNLIDYELPDLDNLEIWGSKERSDAFKSAINELRIAYRDAYE